MNVGKFDLTNTKKGDDIKGISAGISFRPTPTTVFRANYTYQLSTDILNNPPAKIGGVQFGFASYF